MTGAATPTFTPRGHACLVTSLRSKSPGSSGTQEEAPGAQARVAQPARHRGPRSRHPGQEAHNHGHDAPDVRAHAPQRVGGGDVPGAARGACHDGAPVTSPSCTPVHCTGGGHGAPNARAHACALTSCWLRQSGSCPRRAAVCAAPLWPRLCFTDAGAECLCLGIHPAARYHDTYLHSIQT
jgi:hypothetical protein